MWKGGVEPGEYVYLSEEEKRRLVDSVVQSAADEMLIIAGTGCESTAETLRLTEDCAKLGAHAALVVTPQYFAGRMRESALMTHFSDISTWRLIWLPGFQNTPISLVSRTAPQMLSSSEKF
jgi:hypothetical protein